MPLIESVFYNFITLLAVVNPIEAGAAFATLTAGATPAQQTAIAARASIVAAIILIGARARPSREVSGRRA